MGKFYGKDWLSWIEEKELELYESYANKNTRKSFLCVGVCPPSGVGLLENFQQRHPRQSSNVCAQFKSCAAHIWSFYWTALCHKWTKLVLSPNIEEEQCTVFFIHLFLFINTLLHHYDFFGVTKIRPILKDSIRAMIFWRQGIIQKKGKVLCRSFWILSE